MKRCPACDRTYADDSVSFCLNDGALLSVAYEPQATLALSESKPSEAPTEVLPAESAITEAARTARSQQTTDASGVTLRTNKCTIRFGGLVAVNPLDMADQRGTN